LALQIEYFATDDCDGCFYGHAERDREAEPFDFWAQFLFSPDMMRSLQKFSIDIELHKNVQTTPCRSIGMALQAFRRLHTFELNVTKNYRRKVNNSIGLVAAVFKDSPYLS